MPTAHNSATSPYANADQAREALRALAHATRNLDDAAEIYPILGALSAATASLSQSLHQIATFHDDRPRATGWRAEDTATDRTAAYHVSWELHRAGQILAQVTTTIDHAHQAEAQVTYELREPAAQLQPRATTHSAPRAPRATRGSVNPIDPMGSGGPVSTVGTPDHGMGL